MVTETGFKCIVNVLSSVPGYLGRPEYFKYQNYWWSKHVFMPAEEHCSASSRCHVPAEDLTLVNMLSH